MPPRQPTALLALALLILPALAAPSSNNDQFKAIAAQVVKPPAPPICCLVPSASSEPSDDILLSFEEWKEKERKRVDKWAAEKSVSGDGEATGSGSESETMEQTQEVPPSSPVVSETPLVARTAPEDDAEPPHFRVPITDRFNYASLDCSARVHTSHRTSKSATSILSYKRDKYMLSPCRDKQFVVVELCDDIRIDTVQLANFEFFSGVFKDFTVSVAKTYTTDPEGWTFAGRYTAKNIRVVQSFHPPTTLRDFYRFIRIDFASHYGNEYYCPVSLLRVYGLTHLEEYKWDVWREESQARSKVASVSTAASPPLEVNEPEPAPAPEIRIPLSYAEFIVASAEASAATKGQPNIVHPDTATSLQSPSSLDDELPSMSTSANSDLKDSSSASESSSLSMEPGSPDPPSLTLVVSAAHTSDGTSEAIHIENESGTANTLSGSILASPIETISATTITYIVSDISSSDNDLPAASLSSTASSSPSHPASAPTTNSNSIYRTIMNRLSALEANHTIFAAYMEDHRIYTRYVEEHTAAVRELLRRVGEDMGRAEGFARAQAQTSARAMAEWERQRKKVDKEQRELVRKVEYLTGEIILEKRLGIAQLLLLLAVLVFLTLTRGSPVTTTVPSVTSASLRAWGRRHLSLKSLSNRSRSASGDWDWVDRLKPRAEVSDGVRIKKEDDDLAQVKVKFPSMSDEDKPKPIVAPTPIRPMLSASTESSRESDVASSATPNTTSSKHKPSPLNFNNQVGLGRPRTKSLGNNTLVFETVAAGRRSRSRTPNAAALSNMRTPHRRPATPTHKYYGPHSVSAAHFPGVMTHSLSQGAHAGPRSARKWARTAHLHELRSPIAHRRAAAVETESPLAQRRVEDGVLATRIASDMTGEGDLPPSDMGVTDVFASTTSSPAPMPVQEVPPSRSGTVSRWNVPGMLHHALAPAEDVFGGGGFGFGFDGEPDDPDSQWVDTDDGESDVEVTTSPVQPMRPPSATSIVPESNAFAAALSSPLPPSPSQVRAASLSVSSSRGSSSPRSDVSHSSSVVWAESGGQVAVGA